jgi:hypothetical protein
VRMQHETLVAQGYEGSEKSESVGSNPDH